MRVRTVLTVFLSFLPIFGQKRDTTKHVFSGQPLTAASSLAPRTVADQFMRSAASGLKLAPEDFAGVYVAKEYRTQHNGVTHLVYKQRFQGFNVYNAEWVVNIDRDGRVINAGGTLYQRPGTGVVLPARSDAAQAVRAAVAAVNSDIGERFVPFIAAGEGSGVSFFHGELPEDIKGEIVWYGVRGALRPAWVFYVTDVDGVSRYATIVEALSKKVLHKRNLTLNQGPRGLVFPNGSPQPNAKPGAALTATPPYIQRTLVPFVGDPVASPKGWVAGTETSGNNTVTGVSSMGFICVTGFNCPYQPVTAKAPNRNFSFPLELGPAAANPSTYSDAATTNLFYWVNKSHDLYYSIGFDEASGNFQMDNFHRGGVDGDPVYAYSQYASAAERSPRINNSAFGSFRDGEDGLPAFMQIFLNTGLIRDLPGYWTDNAFDPETILHEYGHGVSTRLVRQLNATHQGGSMGEGWSDFWALEFLTLEGAPVDGAYPIFEYPDQKFGVGIRTRPYSTDMNINPLTFANLGRVFFMPEVHGDGEIWFEALWDMRANLIRQFGEKEGRRRVRLLVIDGMKLSPPAPSMLDMRDSILLADRTDFDGKSQDQIWTAFAKRGMGVLAQSGSGDSIFISSSFDLPSRTGKMKFYNDTYTIGELVRIVLHDSNQTAPRVRIQLTTSSGDLENLDLDRVEGNVYAGSIPTDYAPVFKSDAALQLIPADKITAYYVDGDAEGGRKLVEVTVSTIPDYSVLYSRGGIPAGVRETALGLRSGFNSQLRILPFEFPFFGKNYTSIRVYNIGLLTFDLPDFSPCTDAFSLSLNKGIAPLWMNLRTDGRAQPNEDVYMSTTGDSITFRWAAETEPDFPGTNPEAVNFSATLFKDGRIEFRYGGGNKNLVAGSQFFSCGPSAPTVGISSGTETYVQLSPLHDSKGTLENALMARFEPGFAPLGGSIGNLESPKQDDKVKGLITARGTIYDVDTTMLIKRLDVLLDGIAVTPANTDIERPDFCNSRQEPSCGGFEFGISARLLNLKPGRHNIQMQATNIRGHITRFPDAPVSFELEAGDSRIPVGKIESPAEGAEIGGSSRIRGYVYGEDFRVAGVDILVDGVTRGRATLADSRPDICGPINDASPNCPRVGFTFNLNTLSSALPLPNGPHKLQARAVDEFGRFTSFPNDPIAITVKNDNRQLATGALTSPKHNDRVKGTVRISGYAYVAGEAKISRVRLVIDGAVYDDIPYGAQRPLECSQLTSVAACPSIGFEIDFNTKRLSNGPHSLGIFVNDDGGNSTFLPGPIQNGINVFVEN